MLTKYAWSGVNLDEVRDVAEAARAALGGHADVAHFVRASLSALGATIQPNGHGFTAQVLGLPRGAKDSLGLARDSTADLGLRSDLPVSPGEHACAHRPDGP